MKVYIDTNTVVARLVVYHPHYANALSLFKQIASREWTPVVSTHGISEMYAVLTQTPFQPRVSPAEAWQLIEHDVIGKFEIQALSPNDYAKIVKECAANGWTGGVIYDAIHVYAARKAQCARIYTANLSHFRRIAPDLHDRIFAP